MSFHIICEYSQPPKFGLTNNCTGLSVESVCCDCWCCRITGGGGEGCSP